MKKLKTNIKKTFIFTNEDSQQFMEKITEHYATAYKMSRSAAYEYLLEEAVLPKDKQLKKLAKDVITEKISVKTGYEIMLDDFYHNEKKRRFLADGIYTRIIFFIYDGKFKNKNIDALKEKLAEYIKYKKSKDANTTSEEALIKKIDEEASEITPYYILMHIEYPYTTTDVDLYKMFFKFIKEILLLTDKGIDQQTAEDIISFAEYLKALNRDW